MDLKNVGEAIAKFEIGKYGFKTVLAHPFLAMAAGAGYLWYRNSKKKRRKHPQESDRLKSTRTAA